MILSKSKVDELLKVFEVSKSISPYDNTREKEELKNASKFISDYHIYGPPPKKNLDNINRNHTLNTNNSILKNSTYRSQKFNNHHETEIQQSLTNLKLGKDNYFKELKTKSLKKSIPKNVDNYQTYNPYTTSIYSSELQKNQTLYSNLLNSQTLTSTKYIYSDENNKYNAYNKSLKPRLLHSSNLKDIPSNPDDVVIKELPPNYTLSMNPVSSGMGVPIGVPMGMNMGQSEVPMMSQEVNEPPPKMIEEIDTNVIPNGDIQQNDMDSIKEEQEEVVNKEEVPEQIEPVQSAGKYQITEFNGPVKVPPGYSTDDEDEFNAIQILNQDLSSWKKKVDKNNIIVYYKLYKTRNEKGEENDNGMFYCDVTFDFPASKINRQLNNYEVRKKWDKSLDKGKFINEENLGNGIIISDYYSYIKMPFIFDDRDMVVRKKRWENYQGETDCVLCQVHSINHPDYPPKKKPVRAEMENRAEYIKPIDANKCKFYFVSKFDMKLSVPSSMMESKGSEGQEKWVKEFIKGLEK